MGGLTGLDHIGPRPSRHLQLMLEDCLVSSGMLEIAGMLWMFCSWLFWKQPAHAMRLHDVAALGTFGFLSNTCQDTLKINKEVVDEKCEKCIVHKLYMSIRFVQKKYGARALPNGDHTHFWFCLFFHDYLFSHVVPCHLRSCSCWHCGSCWHCVISESLAVKIVKKYQEIVASLNPSECLFCHPVAMQNVGWFEKCIELRYMSFDLIWIYTDTIKQHWKAWAPASDQRQPIEVDFASKVMTRRLTERWIECFSSARTHDSVSQLEHESFISFGNQIVTLWMRRMRCSKIIESWDGPRRVGLFREYAISLWGHPVARPLRIRFEAARVRVGRGQSCHIMSIVFLFKEFQKVFFGIIWNVFVPCLMRVGKHTVY